MKKPTIIQKIKDRLELINEKLEKNNSNYYIILSEYNSYYHLEEVVKKDKSKPINKYDISVNRSIISGSKKNIDDILYTVNYVLGFIESKVKELK